ncbi:MAG: MetQ/NlpA family ABC transporter substrate-binding protein [Succinivibrio sp.]|jgi:D-methionine transport system substrate-binding protein|nr:MetQ/NlpA family ABC transporter substrate-binding protein [Succinivibrio sp.]
MKKFALTTAVLSLAAGLFLGTPAASAADSAIPQTIKFGFAPGPYRGIVEKFVEPQLKEQGYKIEYVDFTDWVTPDSALESGDVDANLFQHSTYLANIVKDQGLHLTPVVGVPTLGIGVFSVKHKTLDELPEGATILIPTDAVNLARALRIAQEVGLIKLNNTSETSEIKASIGDITENPRKLDFVPVDAAQITRSLDSADAGFVPGNFAEAAKLDYSKALAVESVQQNIINVIAVREGDKDTIGKLLKDAVQSDYFRQHLNADHYYDSFTRPQWWSEK